MITNDIFSNEEKRLLDFILQQDFEKKDDTINYLNSLSAEHIVRDFSPYYKIMEFRTSKIKDGYHGMSVMILIQIVRKDGIAPTVYICTLKTDFLLSMRFIMRTAVLWIWMLF